MWVCQCVRVFIGSERLFQAILPLFESLSALIALNYWMRS